MGDIRTRCQRRADLENNSHIVNDEWAALISEQYGELWSIASSTGLRYFETTFLITTDGSLSYQEPVSHFETVGVDHIIDTVGRRRELSEAQSQDISRLRGLTGDAYKYAHIDDQIWLYPTPPAGQTYEMLYVPQPTDLSGYADSDIVDLSTPDGEAFLIWGVAVKALAKSETNTELAVAEREAARIRFTEACILKALTSSRHREVRGQGGYGYGFGDDGYDDESSFRWNPPR